MQKLFDLITKVAEDDYSTILIRGESGTGKELVAKAIHAQSRRSTKNFVPVNCAAIPDDLLESELFGYTKGAFTGATANKQGRIQYADGGTLFLDEIGDMKSSLAGKTAEGPAGKGIRAGRGLQGHPGGYPRPGCHTLRSRTTCQRRKIQGGSLLPLERHPHHHLTTQGAER